MEQLELNNDEMEIKALDSKVYVTKDYEQFKLMGGNRVVNRTHVERIKRSMQDKQLLSPIIVNEKNEIIDGQHRFYAISELGLPLYYIICEGYGIDEVRKLNQINNTWTSKDFLDCFVAMGNENYTYVKKFIKEHNISVKVSMMLLKPPHMNEKDILKEFRAGQFIANVEGVAIANKFLDCLETFSSFPQYKTLMFVKAYYKLFNSQRYNHDNMERKVEYMSGRLEKRNTINQYLNMLTDVYNARTPQNQRIYFHNGVEIK